MLKKLLFSWVVLLFICIGAQAQRMTDRLDRGLVAVKTSEGVYCSWRINAEEYYDVAYNLYRDGVKVNQEPLNVSNYTDTGGSTESVYTVSAVVRGKEQSASKPATVWSTNYLELKPDHGQLKSTYVPNDACCADVDGDGEVEILLKFDNSSWAGTSYAKAGYQGEYCIIEVYKLSGEKLWWIDLGPNMADFQNNEQNIVAYDWDGDGKAEAVMRASDGTVIHMADGKTYTIGDATKNYLAPTSSGQWFVHDGQEFLVYMNGETGEPYQVLEYPLKRLEDGETNLSAAWGDGYGHRSTKHFFGAPCLDGRHPSIFLARGIYTRHKMIAYDVDPATHQLSVRWRWSCNTPGSPWYGQGYHNYQVADVDWDGRDEIVFGSMVIDDNGHGLSTTGLGHGDAQHCSDFNPYIHGHEMFACNEDNPSNNYRDATTSKIYYRLSGGSDDGRSMCGNFSNDYPGAMGSSGHDRPISCVTNDHIEGAGGFDLNFRIYWDGDLLEETFNGSDTRNSAGRIFKYGKGNIETLPGSLTNNDTKATPCYQGDILGDWREEVIMRTAANNIRIYTTIIPTQWRNYTLWHDMQYRQAMVWQMCGYNQPPHTSYFLGELEGITMAPPALTMTDRKEIANGGTISAAHDDQQVLLAETGDMTVSVSDGASPYIFFDNAPSWVQGHDDNDHITTTYYTHTLTGGAFAGSMRLVKQGDGTLVLPQVTQKYTGATDVWAGTLQFDGTMESSRVWLNRFAVLSSDGGSFKNGIVMDYASALLPGGKDHVGTVETDSLILHFGAHLQMDVYGDTQAADYVKAGVLVLEKKDWQYGPAYSTPVIQIVTHFAENATALPEGKYLLGEFGKIEGSLSDVVVEGVGAQKASLTQEDGKVYLVIEGLREPTSITWTGSEGSDWDLAETENFKSTSSGEGNIFVTGDHVVFNDDAVNTTVNIVRPVSPASISFENETKAFTVKGDSIIGNVTINKSGAANVNINNVNSFNGTVNINGGKITVNSLANESGVTLGSLGGVDNTIVLRNGGFLAGAGSVSTSQPIVLGSGGGGIFVPMGQSFTTSSSINSNVNSNLTKTGNGSLTLGSRAAFNALYAMAGTVHGSENGSSVHQYPDSVVLCGSTLRDPDNMYSYSSNKTNVVVPEGYESSWYLDSRCNYTGTLKGSGTLSVYATSIRNVIAGNWNGFSGDLTIGAAKSGSYEPVFYFNNSNGLRNASVTLNTTFSSGASGDNVINKSNSVSFGDLKGSGTLSGSGRYTIGHLNNDISWNGKIDGCVITKVGSGRWTLSLPSNYGKGSAEVKGGILNLNHVASNSLFFGDNQIVASDSGTIAGRAYVSSIYVQNGGSLTPGDITSAYPVGGIKVRNSVFAYAGSHVNFFIYKPTNTATARSFLNVEGYLSVDGDINVAMRGYTPKSGDEIILWTADNFTGTPTAVNLPDISEYGLAWDTSDLLKPTGILRVTTAEAIHTIDAGDMAHAEVYTAQGVAVASFDCERAQLQKHLRAFAPGTYVIRMTSGRRSETIKITIK